MQLQQLILQTTFYRHFEVFTLFHENFLIIAIVICHVTVNDHRIAKGAKCVELTNYSKNKLLHIQLSKVVTHI